MENRKRLLLYIEKLPMADSDPMYMSYEPCTRWGQYLQALGTLYMLTI